MKLLALGAIALTFGLAGSGAAALASGRASSPPITPHTTTAPDGTVTYTDTGCSYFMSSCTDIVKPDGTDTSIFTYVSDAVVTVVTRPGGVLVSFTSSPSKGQVKTTTNAAGAITRVMKFWNGTTFTITFAKNGDLTWLPDGLAPNFASPQMIPLRGVFFGNDMYGPCPKIKGISLCKGVSVWLAKPTAVVKRETTMIFRGRITDPAKNYFYEMQLIKGYMDGPHVDATNGDNGWIKVVRTVHMSLTWKAKPGHYTILLSEGAVGGPRGIAIIYTSWRFVVR
jgi:hypothetical protein